MPTSTLRLATLTDADLLAQMGAETFFDTYASANTPEDMAAYLSKWFSPGQLAGELADPQTCFVIAERDGQPAGFAKLHAGEVGSGVSGERPIELARIYSRKQWIGLGVGGALMQGCLDEAGRRNHDVIWLGVWEHNIRAQAFYRRWGFEQVGTQSFQLGSDLQHDYVLQRPVQITR
jgi:diamine N-acetyltransferase